MDITSISKQIEDAFLCIKQLQKERELDDAIAECRKVIVKARKNRLYHKELQAYNLLFLLYRGKGDYQEALEQFDTVIEVAKKHGLEKSEETSEAYFNAAALLCNVQPPLPQVVTLMEKAIEIRRSIVNDSSDSLISDYQYCLEAYKRVYASVLKKKTTKPAIMTGC